MTKRENKGFKNSAKCWICDNDYFNNNDKERDHCYTTGKYRDSVHRDCNMNLKLNQKIPVEFHNLKNYNSHFIMPELDKFNLKFNVISNGLEKYQ